MKVASLTKGVYAVNVVGLMTWHVIQVRKTGKLWKREGGRWQSGARISHKG